MDVPKSKLYHKHEMNTRSLLQTYFSFDRETIYGEETLNFQMKKIHDSLAAGNFKGKTAYDFSIASLIHQLYKVCDYYPEITILKLNDTCIMELNKWLAMRTGAFDWSHAHDYVKGLHSTRKIKGVETSMFNYATQGHRADSGEEHHPSPAREPTPPPEATQEEAVAQDPPATATTSAEGSPWSLPSLVEVERPSLDPGRPVTVWRDVPRDERVAWFFHEIRLCHLQIDFLQSGLDGLRKRLANLHQWGVHHFQTMETRSLHRQASSSQSQSPPSPLDLSRT
ncbi:uncharacterized protein [Eleutherodactylus coqui]|uniref:uncharacterized protein isoform X1 n=1 Tax=Eleutherodactylus coqui TaxID=57060 RepID=UPI003462DE61